MGMEGGKRGKTIVTSRAKNPVQFQQGEERDDRGYVCNVYTIRRRVIWSGGGDGGRRYRDEKNNERRISEDPEGHDMNESGSRLNR